MNHYSDIDKQAVKTFIMSKIAKQLDEALDHLEKQYAYDPFHHEVWIDSFYGTFKLHFVPANEMNDGQNYSLSFDYHKHNK